MTHFRSKIKDHRDEELRENREEEWRTNREEELRMTRFRPCIKEHRDHREGRRGEEKALRESTKDNSPEGQAGQESDQQHAQVVVAADH